MQELKPQLIKLKELSGKPMIACLKAVHKFPNDLGKQLEYIQTIDIKHSCLLN